MKPLLRISGHVIRQTTAWHDLYFMFAPDVDAVLASGGTTSESHEAPSPEAAVIPQKPCDDVPRAGEPAPVDTGEIQNAMESLFHNRWHSHVELMDRMQMRLRFLESHALSVAAKPTDAGEAEFCRYCGAGIGKHRREGEGTCPECDPQK